VGGKITDNAMILNEVSHPLRSKALMILAEEEASPVEIGRLLGAEASHIAYHVRILCGAGLIRLVQELPKRGSVEHRYVGVVNDHPTKRWYEITDPAVATRRAFRTLCVLWAEANCALGSGSFDGEHRIARYPMKVDRVAEEELADLHNAVDAECQRIGTEAVERLQSAGGTGRSVTAFSGYFDSPKVR
jgi:DNA-binding transcriptional ArsR family regulator